MRSLKGTCGPLSPLEWECSDCAEQQDLQQYHPSQLTELKSTKPEAGSLGSLLDAEDGAKGSLPLNGSPGPFLL